jgi:membrane protease YdiL (CAAX protease family)
MFWSRLPASLRAIVSGLLVALVAANVWPLLLVSLGVPLAAICEAIFLSLYIWWAAGGGPPRSTQHSRAFAFRRRALSSTQWSWSIVAALFFAVTIHAAIVLLFRFVPFPKEAFRHGYDLAFIPSLPLKWLAVVVSAASAGICEETGFRGYMQRPIEQRHGAPIAILVSSLFFTLLHLNKTWATPRDGTQGWTKDGSDLVTAASAILKRKRGDAALTIFVKPENGGSQVQIFTEGLAWDEK